jgi:hypothetical protein
LVFDVVGVLDLCESTEVYLHALSVVFAFQLTVNSVIELAVSLVRQFRVEELPSLSFSLAVLEHLGEESLLLLDFESDEVCVKAGLNPTQLGLSLAWVFGLVSLQKVEDRSEV